MGGGNAVKGVNSIIGQNWNILRWCGVHTLKNQKIRLRKWLPEVRYQQQRTM